MRRAVAAVVAAGRAIASKPLRGTAIGLRAFAVAASSGSARGRSVYVCSSCGNESPKWAGQCGACGAWDTLSAVRGVGAAAAGSRNVSPSQYAAAAGATGDAAPGPAARRSWLGDGAAGAAGRLVPLAAITQAHAKRRSLGSGELDRLFGGGIVAGSVTLLAGSPGVGKSTLLLQMAALLSGATRRASTADGTAGSAEPYASFFCQRTGREGGRSPAPVTASAVAYVSGEESASQIKARADRLGMVAPGLLVMNETRLEEILAQLDSAAPALKTAMDAGGAGAAARGRAPAGGAGASGTAETAAPLSSSPFAALIVDSIQTMFTDAAPSAAGTVTQVRECAVRLLQWAKATGVPVFLVGHVTKSGDVAGPRVLEHLVDTVVQIEADDASGVSAAAGGAYGSGTGSNSLASTASLRLMRTTKNRFGSTSEVGLFEMTDGGFVESNPATAFLSNVPGDPAAGEEAEEPADDDPDEEPAAARGSGSAVTVTMEGTRPLCVEIQALATPSGFAYPRHRSMGLPLDRIAMLLAVLSRHARVRTHSSDVLVNVVGGLRLFDTATDLAVALSLASGLYGRALPRAMVAIGEVGLGGEIRPVPQTAARVAAAAKLGFRTAYVPAVRGGGDKGGEKGGAKLSAGIGFVPGITIVPVRTLTAAVDAVFGPAAMRKAAVRQRRGSSRLPVGPAAAMAAAAAAGSMAMSPSPRHAAPPGGGEFEGMSVDQYLAMSESSEREADE